MARARKGNQFDPELAQIVCDQSETILSGLDSIVTWDAVIDAEPALAIVLSGDHVDTALLAIANFVDLKSPYTLGHAGAVADLAADAGSLSSGCPKARCARFAARGSCTTSAGSGSRTRSGTSRDRSAPANGSACASTRI